MKKHIVAAAMAVAAGAALVGAPTESQAIPAFARQTGSACLNCHFMSFPTLAQFGRAFKQGAFTDVGDQALVEDEGLSIPSVLNMTFVIRGSIDKVKKTPLPAGAAAGTKTSWTNYAFPRDTVLLIAGRIGEHTGAFIEFDGQSPVSNWQLMNSFDTGNVKLGLNIANTGFGWTAPIEVSSVFGQHGGMLNGKNISATEQIMQQVPNVLANLNPPQGGNTLGIALWGGNDLFTAQAGLYAPTTAANGATGQATIDNSAAFGVRVFVTPEVAGLDVGVGFGYVGGKVFNAGFGVGTAKVDYNMWFIDAQVQGEAGDVQYGVYADYAVAPSKAPNADGLGNYLAGGAANTKLSGFSIRGAVKPVHNIVAMIGYGALKQTNNQPAVGQPGSVTQKSTLVGVEYELYQNAVIALIYENTKNANFTPGAKNTRTRLEWEALM